MAVLLVLLQVGLFLFFKSNHKTIALFLFMVFIFAMLLFSPENYWSDMDTIFTEGEREGTGKERIESWKAGWNMFLDHPFLGVGPMNFGSMVA